MWLSVVARTIDTVPSPADLAQHLPAIRRVVWIVLGGLLGVFACMVTLVGSLSAVPGYQSRTSLDGNLTDLGVLVILAWLLGVATLFLRGRMPWVVVVAGAVLTVLLRLDSTLLLLGAGSVVLRRDRRQGLVATGTAVLLTLLAAVRDGSRPSGHTAWQIMFSGSDPALAGAPDGAFRLGVSLGIATIAAVVFLGTAWLVRLRRDLRETGMARAEAETRSEDLETTAYRLEERERLAREVHDALSHRLSLISLHSGALEEAAKDSSPQVSHAAEVLRDNAHRSLEDLRDLVGALREPAGPGRHAAAPEPSHVPPVGLAALPELVTSARSSGAQVQATVMVRDADSASDLLNRAAYRITQEALTNAFKHAPGQPILVDVRADPDSGVSIVVMNRDTDVDSGLPGSGSGLVGMQERADVLGGTFSAGRDGQGSFVVQATLPWQARSTS
ncbi:Histidine kinase [Raineyella antarctica]|uniref:histidine kinase n=1 Tax=Raineyella antarctica TaxID=1577474 RepID=A0A1G6GX73_9ACTN|nr:histidine kinase [Raineyella antarctica]SDB86589.1 Histidine kinase [Raineyella antarctica]